MDHSTTLAAGNGHANGHAARLANRFPSVTADSPALVSCLIALDVSQSEQRQGPRNAAHHRQQISSDRVRRCRRRLWLADHAQNQAGRDGQKKRDVPGAKPFVQDEWREQQQIERRCRLEKDRVRRRRQLRREDEQGDCRRVDDASRQHRWREDEQLHPAPGRQATQQHQEGERGDARSQRRYLQACEGGGLDPSSARGEQDRGRKDLQSSDANAHAITIMAVRRIFATVICLAELLFL